jgi:hypothetical protein
VTAAAERWQEILAVCPPCSTVAQVGWNGVGYAPCDSCGRPMMTSFIRFMDPPEPDAEGVKSYDILA